MLFGRLPRADASSPDRWERPADAMLVVSLHYCIFIIVVVSLHYCLLSLFCGWKFRNVYCGRRSIVENLVYSMKN